MQNECRTSALRGGRASLGVGPLLSGRDLDLSNPSLEVGEPQRREGMARSRFHSGARATTWDSGRRRRPNLGLRQRGVQLGRENSVDSLSDCTLQLIEEK
jgi:hypothetical protein